VVYILDTILDVFFPRNLKCIFCNKDIDENDEYSLCYDCKNKASVIKGNVCKFCGRSIFNGNICLECEKNRYYFTKGISILEYNNISKKLILDLKYNKKTYIAYYFGKMIYDKLILEDLFDFDIITFVPSSKEKKRKRGYNPSKLIAKYVSKFGNVSYEELLIKENDTVELKNLNRMQRKLTVKDSFTALETNLNINKCLIIDDVFTTGSTINECSKMLYEKYLCDITIATVYVGTIDK
jgi:competence protein ComFC